MAGDDQPRGDGDSQDLIGRWLAHHERHSNDDPATQTPEPAGPVPPATVPPATVPPVASGEAVDELDRQPPPGWEPVLLRSVRLENERAEARSVPQAAVVESLLETAPEVAREEMPGVYAFAPRRAARRLMTVVLLAGLVATAYVGRAAIEAQDTASIALAAIVSIATALVWAIRAGTSTVRLVVRQGQLEVTRQGGRHVFDLASTFTQVEVHGRAGRRGWRVVFARRAMAPFVVDAGMVDPHDFMRVLRFFRPDLPS